MPDLQGQRYFHTYLEKEVIIVHRFKYTPFGEEKDYVVVYDGNWFTVTTEENLKPLEETRWFKRRVQLQGEIEKLEERKDERIKQIKKEAASSLVARLKMNSVFTLKGELTQVGLAIATQLEKLVEDQSVVKD